MGETCSTHGRDLVLVRKLEGNTPLGRPRHRWEDNMKINLEKVGCGVMEWIELAQDRAGGGHL
jgi:hypothetical protein